MTLLYSALPHNVLLALYIIICVVQYNYTYFIERSCPRFTALYNPDKKCSHIHTSSLTRWRQWPSLARWPCLAILSMSKCGGHWEWSLPGSLSFSVVLLRPTPSQRDGSAILRGHVSHERYTVSNVEGRELNLHRPIPRAPGIEPRAAAQQAHVLPLVLLQPSSNHSAGADLWGWGWPSHWATEYLFFLFFMNTSCLKFDGLCSL